MTTLAIFDLDGTLLNTISDLGKACNYALSNLGFPIHPAEAYNGMVGNGLRRLVERAAPAGTPASDIDSLIRIFKSYYDGHCADTTFPYPGIPELLRSLLTKGVNLAVASNKYQEAVSFIIRHYFPDIPFVSVQGQREGRPIKPDPAIVESILDDLPTDKERVVMIGDSKVDVETARNAGVLSIAVEWGFSPSDVLKGAGPDFLAYSPSQIMEFLVNLIHT